MHREMMPTYLIQWEAMRWARSVGCDEYDLWGVPDYDLDTLEANFSNRSDGLWGVYRFKRGFGGELRRAVGPWVSSIQVPACLFPVFAVDEDDRQRAVITADQPMDALHLEFLLSRNFPTPIYCKPGSGGMSNQNMVGFRSGYLV